MRPPAWVLMMVMLPLSGWVTSADQPTPITLCDLAQDYASYSGRRVQVRGVYYYGLREACPQNCAEGPWPSFIDLEGGNDRTWKPLAEEQKRVESDAKTTGRRFEIWVTVTGRLEAPVIRSPLGPCDRAVRGHYGHLGAFPAQLTIESIGEIEVKENAQSPYDYAHYYRGIL